MPEESAVTAAGLTKAYGSVGVLAGVDLQLRRGGVLALLGPNGAGKTTTVRILATLVRADAGSARVAGFDVATQPRRVRRSISLTGQFTAVDDLQTGAENLRMTGRLCGLRGAELRARVADLLDAFDLTQAADRRVGTYSGGMRRRLDLAAGLVGRPQVVFLDEPTTGLDPRSRREAWRMVADLAGSGVSIFLTTQYLEEADRLADTVAVLDGGRVVAQDSPARLKSRLGGRRLDLTLADPAAYAEVSRRAAERALTRDEPGLRIGVATDGGAAHVRALLDELDPDRTAIREFSVHTATLDEVFLALTGRPAARPDQELTHA